MMLAEVAHQNVQLFPWQITVLSNIISMDENFPEKRCQLR